MNILAVNLTEQIYQKILKPVFFQFDAEFLHNRVTFLGEKLAGNPLLTKGIAKVFNNRDRRLLQNIQGINFSTPIGLAAGFDYEARLTQITPIIGFGFQTIGTITNYPYEGNPKPRLGRLPNSKSLLVNKGFKNPGALKTAVKLQGLHFKIPIGVSIGRTNTRVLDQKQSIEDILQAFKIFENFNLQHAYYELNISCPNLYGNVTFYTPLKLAELLTKLDKLGLNRPVFVKMPIDLADKLTLQLLETISKHEIKGVIFGNLQKDRKHPSLNQLEVKKCGKGNFSGKPTFDRSNELIALAYKHYRKRLTIIGCGGVFTAEDAYLKMTLGASLVQLITGLVFQGPQLVSQINAGLIRRLETDRVRNISDVVGVGSK